MECMYDILSGPYVFWQGNNDHISAPIHSVETQLFPSSAAAFWHSMMSGIPKGLCEVEIILEIVTSAPIRIGMTFNVVLLISLACPARSSHLTMFDCSALYPKYRHDCWGPFMTTLIHWNNIEGGNSLQTLVIQIGRISQELHLHILDTDGDECLHSFSVHSRPYFQQSYHSCHCFLGAIF